MKICLNLSEVTAKILSVAFFLTWCIYWFRYKTRTCRTDRQTDSDSHPTTAWSRGFCMSFSRLFKQHFDVYELREAPLSQINHATL